MVDTPYNAKTDKINIGSRTGSATGDVLAEQSDRAEDVLGERGEQYKQQARRQRLVAQRIRQWSEDADVKNQKRKPRNAVFQDSKKEANQPLSYVDIGTMSAVALFFDLIQGILSLFPVVGNVITGFTVFPVATLSLYLMYKKRGIEFKSTKTLVKYWGSLLIGFIPVLSIFPEYFLNVILMSAEKKAEEKLKI